MLPKKLGGLFDCLKAVAIVGHKVHHKRVLDLGSQPLLDETGVYDDSACSVAVNDHLGAHMDKAGLGDARDEISVYNYAEAIGALLVVLGGKVPVAHSGRAEVVHGADNFLVLGVLRLVDALETPVVVDSRQRVDGYVPTC